MPVLTIQIPNKQLKEIKIRARNEGFSNPTEWARILVSRYLELEESPVMKPTRVIHTMKKTGLYKTSFLKGLGQSLDYADKNAQR